MPTVPTEQNRVGIAGVTDAKLQPGDYSNTGLQALGAGMQQLAETGQKIAPVLQQRQDSDDDFEIKKAWNAYAEGARSIRADAMGKFDADPKGALAQVTQDYGGLRDWIRSGLKNDRQRDLFDRVIAERFDYDLSGALTESEKALRRGEDAQGLLLEQNAADDAVGNAGDPALFDKYLHTGAESIARRASARGDDPATIEQGVTAYRSGIQRRVLQDMIGADPVAAANRYRAMRDGMTPADRQTAERELLEPLARALGVRDVDALLPSPETEGPVPLSPEQRASLAEAIETQPWTEVRKRYAREDLATRGGLADRQRQRAADDARDEGLAIIERLGPDFTSIAQLPPQVRRDLDDDTAQTLGVIAQGNLDGRPVAPNGVTSLMMNLIASQNPAAFAKEDLRLVRGKVTPEEYETFVRLQRSIRESGAVNDNATLHRVFGKLGQSSFPMKEIAADEQNIPRLINASATLMGAERSTGRGLKRRKKPERTVIYLNESIDADNIEAINAMGSPEGWSIIYSHGYPETGAISDTSRGADPQSVSTKTIYRQLIGAKYVRGGPIIITSCFAANGPQPRELSKMTGGVVYAAKAFVSAPSSSNERYDLSVNTEKYGGGDVVGYAKYVNGVEVPSTLMNVYFDPKTKRWFRVDSKIPYPPGKKIAPRRKIINSDQGR